MTATIEVVRSRRQLHEFIDLPEQLWPTSHQVPLLASTITSWWQGSSPHPEKIELVLVRDASGRAIGRSTVHTDARLDSKLGTSLLLFGALVFSDPAAGRALIEHYERRAQQLGKTEVLGPVSLLPNQSAGIITAAFDQPGFTDAAWNPASVPQTFTEAGYHSWNEGSTWRVPVGAVAVVAPSGAELKAAGIRLEYGAKKHITTLIPELLTLLNASFDQLPYFTPITPDEMKDATDGLAFLLDEKLLILAREATTGEAVAFVLVVPDITAYLQSIGGKLGLIQQLVLLATRSRYRQKAILIIQGTDPRLQGRGILSLLSRQLQHNLQQGGYTELRTTTVGTANPGSARQFERFGGTALHPTVLYRKRVTLEEHVSPLGTKGP